MARIFSFGLIMALAIGINGNSANAQIIQDDFDSYANGTTLQNINGWSGWGQNAAVAGTVSNTFSNSAPNSIEIQQQTDAVNAMCNASSGHWCFTINQYLPSNGIGVQYFIMQNTYTNDLSVLNWSIQMPCNMDTGMVTDDFDAGAPAQPIIFDTWVEILIDIDFDADTVDEYYNGVLMSTGVWSQRGTGGGLIAMGAVDLYGADDGGTPGYYDDLVFLKKLPPPVFWPPESFSVFRGMTISADLTDFEFSDDVRARFNPGFVLNNQEAPVWLIFDANCPTASGFLVESQAGTPGLSYTVEAFNWNTGTYDVTRVEGATFNNDTSTKHAIVAADHIDGDGNVRSRVGWRKTGLTINFPWEVRIDQVGWNQDGTKPRPAFIDDIFPLTGEPGTIITVTGGGFGTDPLDCCFVLRQDNRLIATQVLSVKDDMIQAVLQYVPEDADGVPQEAMLRFGNGLLTTIKPDFPDVIVEPDQWAWGFDECNRGDPQAVAAPMPFVPIFVPPSSGQSYHSGPPQNGVLCVNITDDWAAGTKFNLYCRVHKQYTGADTNFYNTCLTVAGSRFDCAVRICDLIQKQLASGSPSLIVNCTVTADGADAKITVSLPGGALIDGGTIDIVVK